MGIVQMRCFLLFILLQCSIASAMSLSSSLPPELSGHHGDECSALFHLSKSFFISRDASEYFCDYSYPKTMTWKNGTDCCTWDGITCDEESRNVVGLDLSCSWLLGTLPPNNTLFSLQHLQGLNLAGNDFCESPISSRFRTFTRMTHLNLSRSVFSGPVPLKLSHLSRLLSLDLSRNYGSVQLEDQLLRRLVQNLTDLRELVLSDVNMSSVSLDSISNISSSLTHLSIIYGLLRGRLPISIFSLPNLESLDLSNNDDLEGTLPQRNWTSPLVSLDLTQTKFQGKLPNSVVHLKYIRELRLGSCQLDGPLPDSLGNLTNLNVLDLGDNHFTGHIPLTIGKLEELTHLELSFNNLSVGSALDFEIIFSKLKNLQVLSLESQLPLSLQNNGNCSFSDLQELSLYCSLTKFPYFLKSSKRIRHLDLSSNKIDSPIPEWFWTIGIDSLERLYLSDNQITGAIPQFPWKIISEVYLTGNFLEKLPPFLPPSIEYFDASNNSFSGNIPSSFCGVTSLIDLDLSDNNLSGTIPECFGSLSKIQLLTLSSNQLEGPLPRSLANCSMLSSLDIGKNKIFDTFPDWLMVSWLKSLRLQSNKFHGLVASETHLFPYSELRYLDLSDNNFSGILPPNIFLNSTLRTIDLSNNRFSGLAPNLPPTIQFFSVSGNLFTGEIPSSVCNTSNLMVVNLSNNSMSGPIPPCLAYSSSSLLVANLRMNNFVGKIPEFCVPGSILTSVDLSQNQIGGALPQSFENCKNLEVLNLGDNRLEDGFPSWLYTLPMLQVLILRSNMFYGHLNCSENSDHLFVKLHILDLSNNKFVGSLPTTVFVGLNAMKNEGKGDLQYMGRRVNFYYYYQDSVKIIMKGAERELVRILTVFTTIDVSGNSFHGFIPEGIGNLKALKGLNFSHNALSANIPSSLGNLTNLEWLDLSSNKLTGQIPTSLAELASLAYLNLSVNQLTGAIPRSTQFDTFNRDSFDGNPGLCGHPLPNACDNPSLDSPGEGEAEHRNRIEWRAVVMGYGFGLGCGISAGYIVLVTRRPRWLVHMVERKRTRKTTRSRKTSTPRNHTRRS